MQHAVVCLLFIHPSTDTTQPNDACRFVHHPSLSTTHPPTHLPTLPLSETVSEISSLGVKYGVGVHVDCCLGGFILPFAKKLGLDIPPFDFSLKGVTSMSVDTHKYAYASKVRSVSSYPPHPPFPFHPTDPFSIHNTGHERGVL